MRMPAAPNKPRTARFVTFAAPIAGWISNRNLSQASQGPQGAALLENWFPIATGAIMRRGSEVYATVGDGSKDVESLFAYVNGNTKKFFASTSDTIYDITSAGAVTSALAAQTAGKWSVVQFATPGGVFLRGVNGSDTPFVFDGTAWGTTPAITFTDGTTPSQLANVWASQNRLWFIKKDALDAYYLPVASIGGAAVVFPLGGVFTRGGELLFGASWSIETLGGLQENTIFVSTQGEVAIYSGSDPSDASTWKLIGVYRIGMPLGPKAWVKAGGDVVIATDIGMIPVSQAMVRDIAALSPNAISYKIETAWNDTVAERVGSDWNAIVWPSAQMMAVAPPTVSGTIPEVFVANARTGAWTKFTGWNATCLGDYDKRCFFGSTGGKIIEANVTGADQGAIYTASYIPLFNDLRAPGSLKIAKAGRVTLRCAVDPLPQLSLNVDFDTATPIAPNVRSVDADSIWDSGLWDEALWSSDASSIATQSKWQSLAGAGYAIAPCVQISSGSIAPIDAQLARIDVTYDQADILT